MNLTYFQPRKRRNVENNSNRRLNIRFVAKILDIRNGLLQTTWSSKTETRLNAESMFCQSEVPIMAVAICVRWTVL